MVAVACPQPPPEWEADVVLADGGPVHVRPIRPDDGDRLLRFHGSLSAESIYYRFFSPKPRLTDREVEKFTHVDYDDRVALVALLGDEFIAVARYDRWPGKDEAEVAFTVSDAHQGRGIGTLLLEHLAAIARSRGIHRFTAEVLPDNRPMLRVFRRAGFEEVRNTFAGGIIDVDFAIDPTPAYLETVEEREQRAESRSIARLVSPKSIAVIGASERPGTLGHELFANLLAGRFDGPVYPINPAVPHVLSVPTHPSIGDVDDDIHLAAVAVPADAVEDVLEQCAAKRVRAVIVYTTGFNDPKEGFDSPDGQRALVQLARRNGMRLLGPASMGLIVTSPTGTMHASFARVPVHFGRVAIASQSGPLGIAMLEAAHRVGVGISTFVSLGTRGDVTVNDVLQFWYDDPSTDVVLLYNQNFGNPRKIARIARRVSRRKPIVAVKAGQEQYRPAPPGDPDAEAIALAADALYLQAGVIRVDSVTELFDVGRVLARQPLPTGPAVAIVSNARSPAALAVAGLAAAGLHRAPLGEATCAALARRLPADVVVDNPLDLTHRSEPGDYRFALEQVLADPGVDAALAIYAPPLVGGVDAFAEAIGEVATAGAKPVLAVALGRGDGLLRPGADDGVPAFAFPEQATAALGRIVRYARWRSRPEGQEGTYDDIDDEAARALVAAVLADHPEGTVLALSAACELLATHGIPFPPARIVTTGDAVVAAADEVGYPVALKAAGLPRLARSESGGVALDLQSPDEVRGAYDRMRAALGAGMAESVVQHMVPAGVETIITVEAHPALGPVVSFGLGGAFADAISDRSARSLPLTDLDAAELVASSRAAVALDATCANQAAVQDVLCRVAHLVDAVPEITRLRLNPVLVSPAGAWAIDAAIHVAPVPPSPLDAPVRRL